MMRPAVPSRSRLLPVAALVVCLTMGCSRGLSSQSRPAEAPKPRPAPALMLSPVAGQSIPLLPPTYVTAPDSIPGLPGTQAERLRWADSMVGELFAMRGPEVTWIRGEALRDAARRAPGTVHDPAQFGQAIFRATSLKAAPDQFLTTLRPLMSMTGGRYAMIPAAFVFSRGATGSVEVASVLVMLDARTGTMLWRSEPTGSGATAGAALAALFSRILPEQ